MTGSRLRTRLRLMFANRGGSSRALPELIDAKMEDMSPSAFRLREGGVYIYIAVSRPRRKPLGA